MINILYFFIFHKRIWSFILQMIFLHLFLVSCFLFISNDSSDLQAVLCPLRLTAVGAAEVHTQTLNRAKAPGSGLLCKGSAAVPPAFILSAKIKGHLLCGEFPLCWKSLKPKFFHQTLVWSCRLWESVPARTAGRKKCLKESGKSAKVDADTADLETHAVNLTVEPKTRPEWSWRASKELAADQNLCSVPEPVKAALQEERR